MTSLSVAETNFFHFSSNASCSSNSETYSNDTCALNSSASSRFLHAMPSFDAPRNVYGEPQSVHFNHRSCHLLVAGSIIVARQGSRARPFVCVYCTRILAISQSNPIPRMPHQSPFFFVCVFSDVRLFAVDVGHASSS
jgi:hypothetical protein